MYSNTATEKKTHPVNIALSRLYSTPSPTLKLAFTLEGMVSFLLALLLVWIVLMEGITKE